MLDLRLGTLIFSLETREGWEGGKEKEGGKTVRERGGGGGRGGEEEREGGNVGFIHGGRIIN